MVQVTKELIEKDFLPAIERGGPPPATLNEFKQMCHMSMRAIASDNVSRGTYDCVKAELDSAILLIAELRALAAAQPGQGGREAFEAWFLEKYPTKTPITAIERRGDGYLMLHANASWLAWRAARTQPPAQPEGELK